MDQILQSRDIERPNECKNNTYVFVAYKRPTSI